MIDVAKEFAKTFYNSKQWRRCREAYIAMRRSIDGGMCESCHETTGYIVHHKIELTPDNITNPDISLNFDNLKYDCHICHNKEGKENKIKNLVNYCFDDRGELISSPPQNEEL